MTIEKMPPETEEQISEWLDEIGRKRAAMECQCSPCETRDVCQSCPPDGKEGK